MEIKVEYKVERNIDLDTNHLVGSIINVKFKAPSNLFYKKLSFTDYRADIPEKEVLKIIRRKISDYIKSRRTGKKILVLDEGGSFIEWKE